MSEVLLFTGEFCGPCDQVKESNVYETHQDQIELVDVEEDQDIANKYNVRSLPALRIVGDDGVEAGDSGLSVIQTLEAHFQ